MMERAREDATERDLMQILNALCYRAELLRSVEQRPHRQPGEAGADDNEQITGGEGNMPELDNNTNQDDEQDNVVQEREH